MQSQVENTGGPAEQVVALVEGIIGNGRVMASENFQRIEGNDPLRAAVDTILQEGEAVDIDAPNEVRDPKAIVMSPSERVSADRLAEMFPFLTPGAEPHTVRVGGLMLPATGPMQYVTESTPYDSSRGPTMVIVGFAASGTERVIFHTKAPLLNATAPSVKWTVTFTTAQAYESSMPSDQPLPPRKAVEVSYG